jgi:hypothetical protein
MKSGRLHAILGYFDSVFNRKTIKGFAERVRSLDELPQAVQVALRPQLELDGPPQLILLAPAQSVLAQPDQVASWWPKKFLPWQITPDQTLVLTPSHLLVVSISHPLEQAVRGMPEVGTAPEKACLSAIPRTEILLIESGTVLLSAWLDLAWVRQGSLERRRIHFNAVAAGLFEDLCRRLRAPLPADAAPVTGTAPAAAPERALLESLPYKFKSLIPRRLLLADEPVRALAFRPALWSRGPALFRHPLQPRLAAVRTDDWLILAEEDLSPDGTTYGLIARFCRLACVRRAAVEETPTGLALALCLAQGGVEHELRLPFSSSARPDLDAICSF